MILNNVIWKKEKKTILFFLLIILFVLSSCSPVDPGDGDPMSEYIYDETKSSDSFELGIGNSSFDPNEGTYSSSNQFEVTGLPDLTYSKVKISTTGIITTQIEINGSVIYSDGVWVKNGDMIVLKYKVEYYGQSGTVTVSIGSISDDISGSAISKNLDGLDYSDGVYLGNISVNNPKNYYAFPIKVTSNRTITHLGVPFQMNPMASGSYIKTIYIYSNDSVNKKPNSLLVTIPFENLNTVYFSGEYTVSGNTAQLSSQYIQGKLQSSYTLTANTIYWVVMQNNDSAFGPYADGAFSSNTTTEGIFGSGYINKMSIDASAWVDWSETATPGLEGKLIRFFVAY